MLNLPSPRAYDPPHYDQAKHPHPATKAFLTDTSPAARIPPNDTTTPSNIDIEPLSTSADNQGVTRMDLDLFSMKFENPEEMIAISPEVAGSDGIYGDRKAQPSRQGEADLVRRHSRTISIASRSISSSPTSGPIHNLPQAGTIISAAIAINHANAPDCTDARTVTTSEDTTACIEPELPAFSGKSMLDHGHSTPDQIRGSGPVYPTLQDSDIKQEELTVEESSPAVSKAYGIAKPPPTLMSMPTPTPELAGKTRPSINHRSIEAPPDAQPVSPEAIRLSQAQARLDIAIVERDKEESQLDEITKAINKIRDSSRNNENQGANNQVRLKLRKTELAETHAKWKEAQAKIKETKDEAIRFSEQRSQLLDDLGENEDKQRNVTSRLETIASQIVRLTRKIKSATDLANLASEFPDRATREFARRVRGLPKASVKSEKVKVEDGKKTTSSSPSPSPSSSASNDEDFSSSSDDDMSISKNSDIDEVSVFNKEWGAIISEGVTIENISRLRECLSTFSPEPVKPGTALASPTHLTKGKPDLDEQKSVSDALAHANALIHHKEQIDSFMICARGSKRKAQELKASDDDKEDNAATDSDEEDIIIPPGEESRGERLREKSMTSRDGSELTIVLHPLKQAQQR